MLRLLVLLIFIGMLAGICSGIVWYFKTPQPIGPYAQVQYLQQLAVYEYYDYKQKPGDDEVGYWQSLADKNNAPAQTHIAELYFEAGANNPNNYIIAVNYLSKAANQGLPTAQNALGVALRKGLGIEQDKMEAYKWFSLAARQGMDLAKANLNSLSQELVDKEIDQGKLRTQLWLRNIKKF